MVVPRAKSLFLIGNGFDLSIGLPTDYKSFYNYYLMTKSPSAVIEKLKQTISPDDENWSDLERAIGNLDIFNKEEEYLECIRDLRNNLRRYLNKTIKSQEGIVQMQNMNECLASPENYLTEARGLVYSEFRSKYQSWLVNVISFNYTDSFDSLLNIKKGGSIATFTTYEGTFHVHGTLKNEMTFGVNDVSQIKVPHFKDSVDVVEEIVKPEYNDACENINNQTCESLIKEANVYVLFGVSMGITDDKWWKLIGSQVNQRADTRVLYFPYDKDVDFSIASNQKRKLNEQHTKFLCDRTGITDENKSKVFTNLNSNIFASRRLKLPK